MITNEGIVIRTDCASISVLKRITSGVKLMHVDSENGIKVANIAKVREQVRADQEDQEEQVESDEENPSDGMQKHIHCSVVISETLLVCKSYQQYSCGKEDGIVENYRWICLLYTSILSGETEDEVRIFFTGNHIVFEFDATTVVSRLIEGEYFKINQMLSSDYETKFIINKKELLDVYKRQTIDRSVLFNNTTTF